MRALYNTLSSRFTLSNKTKKQSNTRTSIERKNEENNNINFDDLADIFEKKETINQPRNLLKKKHSTTYQRKSNKEKNINFDNLFNEKYEMPEPPNHFILPNVPTTPIYMFPEPPDLTDEQYNKTREDALELIPHIMNGHLENTKALIQLIQKCQCTLDNDIKKKLKKTFKLYNDYCDKVKTLDRNKKIGGKTKKYKRKIINQIK